VPDRLGLNRLVLYVACQRVIKIPFTVVNLKLYRLHITIGKELFNLSAIRVRKSHQGFFGTAKIKRGAVTADSLFQTPDIPVDIPVQEFKKQAEVFGLPFMWSGGHEQVVVSHPGQGLTQLIGQSLFVCTIGAHLVGFVYNNEIPVATQETILGVLDA
jgi:hypothetical protein